MVVASYTCSSGTTGSVVAYPTVADQAPGEVLLRPRTGERQLSVALADSTGRPVAAVLLEAKIAHGDLVELGAVCSRTARPVRLLSLQPVHVRVLAGNACGLLSVPTQGAVKGTFRR
jgi:hypothetical protein